MNVFATHERTTIRLALGSFHEPADVFLILLDGLPSSIEAPGFLVPPRRDKIIKAAQRMGWALELANWSALETKEGHPTRWVSAIIGRWPLAA